MTDPPGPGRPEALPSQEAEGGFTSPHEEPTRPYESEPPACGDAAAATAFGAASPPPPPPAPSGPPPFLGLSSRPSAPPPPPATWPQAPEDRVTRPQHALHVDRAAALLTPSASSRPGLPDLAATDIDPDTAEPPPFGTLLPPARRTTPAPHAPAPSARRPVLLGVVLGLLLGAPAIWLALRPPSSDRPPRPTEPEAPAQPEAPAHRAPASAARLVPARSPLPSEPEPTLRGDRSQPPTPQRHATGAPLPPEAEARIEAALREARHHFEARRYRQAHRAVRRASERLPEGAPPALRARVLTLQGRILLERGPIAARQAAPLLAEATSLPGSPTEAWLLYGEALLQSSPPRPRAAADALRRYLREAGTTISPAARRRAHRLLRRTGTRTKTHGTD